jgi:antitoxin (DNA-binding transcriptional repressor) of toxin-antitoxin stability system
MPKAEARRRFSEVTTRVGRRGERGKITHYGKTLAVLVSKQDLQRLSDWESDQRPVSGDRGRRRR